MTPLEDIHREEILTSRVRAVCERRLQGICTKPYHCHPHGCPNWDKKEGCPPTALFFPEAYEPEVYVAAIAWDFSSYLGLMRERHPRWSEFQLRCPLYWQGFLRRKLRDFVTPLTRSFAADGYTCITTPEAMGVDVTATCAAAGIELEWPPTSLVHVVVVFARPF